MSDSDLSARLPGPVTGRPRRPLSNSASTASWSMRFSLLTMISGAPRSSSRLRRLLRLMTRRERAVRSDVAKRPPEGGGGGGRAQPPAVELDHRAQLRRDDRHGLEDHHLRLVAGVQEGGEHLQALDRAGLLLALAGAHLLLEVEALVLEDDAGHVLRAQVVAGRALGVGVAHGRVPVVVGLLAQQVADVLGAHAAAEVLAEAERRPEAVL